MFDREHSEYPATDPNISQHLEYPATEIAIHKPAGDVTEEMPPIEVVQPMSKAERALENMIAEQNRKKKISIEEKITIGKRETTEALFENSLENELFAIALDKVRDAYRYHLTKRDFMRRRLLVKVDIALSELGDPNITPEKETLAERHRAALHAIREQVANETFSEDVKGFTLADYVDPDEVQDQKGPIIEKEDTGTKMSMQLRSVVTEAIKATFDEAMRDPTLTRDNAWIAYRKVLHAYEKGIPEYTEMRERLLEAIDRQLAGNNLAIRKSLHEYLTLLRTVIVTIQTNEMIADISNGIGVEETSQNIRTERTESDGKGIQKFSATDQKDSQEDQLAA